MTIVPAGDILESATLVGLNTPPLSIPTAGEGASGRLFQADDYVSPTAANVQYSTYTLGPRIPWNAKIKRVQMYGKGIDTNATAAFAVDINVIFSDAPLGGIAAAQPTQDGTSATNAGQVLTDDLDGSTETITAYVEPNKMFGAGLVAVANSGAYKLQDITHAGTFTFAHRLLPMWDVFGFANDPGGFFNFYVVCATASSTAAAGTLGLIVDFMV